MIPRLHKRGLSFKGACSYILHDPDNQTSDARVAWTLTRNLISGADDAWFEMFATFRDQALLKEAAGIDARGRKNTHPVLHFSLSWAPNEAPDEEHMRATALSALKALGLEEHQAVLAGHSDKAHTHLHVIVNTVHPITGRTAAQKFSKLEFSRWAEAYEREYGIQVEQRLLNNADRDAVRRVRQFEHAHGTESSFYLAIRDKSPGRREWLASELNLSDHRDPVRKILSSLTRTQSTFTRADMARAVSILTKDAASFGALMAKIETSDELARLAGTDRLSTQTMVRSEAILAATVDAMAQDKTHPIERAGKRLRLGFIGLTPGQRAALEHVTGPEAIACVSGYAGVGKSTMLAAARTIWEASGYTVRGATLSGIAAQGLEQSAGIATTTLHSLQYKLETKALTFTNRDVLVIDEAGMVGSRQMQQVISQARLGGAKVVLVGDTEQLQAIEAGAPYRAVAERCGTATIEAVRRQRDVWQRDATVALATGRTRAALRAYEAHGGIVEAKTREQAMKTLLRNWEGSLTEVRSKSPDLILAPTRVDVHQLNRKARDVMRGHGRLGEDRRIEAIEDRGVSQSRKLVLDLAVGDRLMFTRNDARMGVRNGTLGTLLAFGAGTLVVRADGNANPVFVDLSRYRNLAHGYAMTVHKAQGVTVDRAHVLAGLSMDRHMAYVALSRHRDGVQLYFGKDQFASHAALAARLSRSRTKDMTIDYPAPGKLMDVGHKSDPPTSRAPAAEKRSDRIRVEAAEWRKRAGHRDFGLEL
jgi:ATP-dependent exoDNAse (exonuclease V) alpha subunit